MRICDFCGVAASDRDRSIPVTVVRYRLFDPELASRQPNSDLDQISWELCHKCQHRVRAVIRSALEEDEKARKELKSDGGRST